MEHLEGEPPRQIAPQIKVALLDAITGGAADGTPVGIYRSGPIIVRFFRRNGYEDSYGGWARMSHTDEKLDEIHQMENGRERILGLVEDAVNPADYVGSEERQIGGTCRRQDRACYWGCAGAWRSSSQNACSRRRESCSHRY